MADPRPHYVTTSRGQVRLWQAGSGANLVALAGLTTAASLKARELAELLPGWRVTVVELPGVGGSSAIAFAGADEAAWAVAEALEWLGGEPCVLAGFDLSGPVAVLLADRLPTPLAELVMVGGDAARAWATSYVDPGDLSPRQDGAHLTALWSFLRDRHLLDPADRGQPAAAGEPLPDETALSETFVAAMVRPQRFAAIWRNCAEAMRATDTGTARAVSLTADLPAVLAGIALPDARSVVPETAPLPGRSIWHQYVETANGRIHLRRAGGEGRPTLVIPTGGGSCAQFAPVISGLAEGRSVFAVDYLGNGLSDKSRRKVTIETLAGDMIALLDALGLEEVDIWGSHTGALVALEVAVTAPERVGRLVLEGPVFISKDFQDDLLANYFPAIRPDKWGLHLPLVWNWRRDLFMFWPWYRVDRAAARRLGVPAAEELHKYAVGILESGETYDGAYRSAFSYDTRARMPLLVRPALVCAGPEDMLKDGLSEAARLGRTDVVTVEETPTTVWWPDPEPAAAARTMRRYREFLAG